MAAPLPPPAELLEILTWPVIIPGAVSTAVLVAAWRPWRRGEHAERGDGAAWAMPVIAGLCCLAAYMAIMNEIRVPSAQRWQSFTVLAFALIPLGALAASIRSATVSLLVSAIGAAALVSWLVDLPTLDTMRQRLGLGLAAAAMILVAEPLAQRRPGPVLPAVFWMSFTALSMTVKNANFAILSLIAAGLSAACGAAIVVGLLTPRFRLSRGGITVLAPLLVVLLAVASIYNQNENLGDTTWYLILAIGPVAWLGEAATFAWLRSRANKRTPAAGGDGVPAAPAPSVVTARSRLASDAARLLLPLLVMVGAIATASMSTGGGDEAAEGEEDYGSIYGG